jgi:hypothetical protein
MALSSEEEEFLQLIIAGIPHIAEAIAAVPPQHRAKVLNAAESSYVQSLQDFGFLESFSQPWTAAVMRRLWARVANPCSHESLEEQFHAVRRTAS